MSERTEEPAREPATSSAAPTKSRERRDEAHQSEQDAHGGFHTSGWAHFEQEAGRIIAGVAKDMHLPPWHVRALTRAEGPVFAAYPDRHCSRHDLDPFVLSRVDVTWDPAPTIEPHLYLEKLPARVRASLQEGQMLAGQGVMKVRTSGHVAGQAIGPTRPLSGAFGVSKPAMRNTIAPTMAGTPIALWRTRLVPLTSSSLTAHM
jgi:hypothetical protein